LFYNSTNLLKKTILDISYFENVKGLLSDDNGKRFKDGLIILVENLNGNPVIFPQRKLNALSRLLPSDER
jgi:uncharacterized protein YkvS